MKIIRRGGGLFFFLLICALLWLAFRRESQLARDLGKGIADQSNAVAASLQAHSDDQRRTMAVDHVVDVFSAPIGFFGRVIDQSGKPVAGARVEFSAVDKIWESGSKLEATSDATGGFSIVGLKGAGLTVAVSKEGYDPIDELSYQAFGYGLGPDSTRKTPPTQESPAVFVLRKKENAEPLFEVDRNLRIPKDGTPVDISLETGKQVSSGQGDLRVQCWTFDQIKNDRRRWEWSFLLSVPGGGVQSRKDPQRNFVAPEIGYQESLAHRMPADAERWVGDYENELWVRLADERFARVRFRIISGGDHFVSIESYLNSKPGSRNLEFDPKKVIKP